MKTSVLVQFIREIMYSGLERIGRYYSKYRAFVSDNEDPEGCSRLKLIIPQVGGNAVYNYWAFPTNVFGGKNYGYQVLPQKGDMVWVEFEGGHPEVPIWSHGYFAKGEKPTGDYRDVNTYWFKSPKGMTVMLNDTKEYILVEFPGSAQSILINKTAVSLVHDKKISLGGKDGSKDKAVLGDKHNKHEKGTLEAIKKLTVMTAMGPSSIPINVSEFEIQIAQIDTILSQKVELD